LSDPASLLIKDVVASYKGRARFISQNWGDSKLAERYGVKRYPVVFVEEVLVAKPEDFGGWGRNTGRYAPWRDPANHTKFKLDLSRMIDLTLRGRAREAAGKSQARTETSAEIAALPLLTVQDIQGQPVESAGLVGRVVVIEFWATWCAPCRSTLNWLGEVKRRYGDQLEIVTIAVESEEPEVRKLLQSLNSPPRVVLGNEALAASFGTITSVPTMFVFDREGKTSEVFYGATEDLHAKAERLFTSLLK
jgi:cytochrome c biogenesis protein CcmG, thiol:disulfide interchange protein DsbE